MVANPSFGVQKASGVFALMQLQSLLVSILSEFCSEWLEIFDDEHLGLHHFFSIRVVAGVLKFQVKIFGSVGFADEFVFAIDFVITVFHLQKYLILVKIELNISIQTLDLQVEGIVSR